MKRVFTLPDDNDRNCFQWDTLPFDTLTIIIFLCLDSSNVTKTIICRLFSLSKVCQNFFRVIVTEIIPVIYRKNADFMATLKHSSWILSCLAPRVKQLDLDTFNIWVYDTHLQSLSGLEKLTICGTPYYITDDSISTLPTSMIYMRIEDNMRIKNNTNYFGRFSNLAYLSLKQSEFCISKREFELMTNLRELSLTSNEFITNVALRALTGLTQLFLSKNTVISGHTLRLLTNLVGLGLESNEKINADDLCNLPNLRSLDLALNRGVSCVSRLTNLEMLSLCGNRVIEGSDLSLLTNLTSLCISSNRNICDVDILSLTQLKKLVANESLFISDYSIKRLTSLEELKINGQFSLVGDGGIEKLMSLHTLHIKENRHVTLHSIALLTNLKVLHLSKYRGDFINSKATAHLRLIIY